MVFLWGTRSDTDPHRKTPTLYSSISISPSTSVFNDMGYFVSQRDLIWTIITQWVPRFHLGWYNDTTGVLLGEGQHLLFELPGMPQDVISKTTPITDVVGNQSYADTSISVSAGHRI